MEEKLIIAAVNAGAGGLIAALIIVLTYRLVTSLLSKLGDKVADALARQATAMETLTLSIKESVEKDNGEHREMLVLLKYIAQRSQAFDQIEREHHERMNDTSHCGRRATDPQLSGEKEKAQE